MPGIIILFNYKGIETNVKCSLNDQNGDIIDKYIAKTSANNCFMSNGKKIGKEKKYKVRLAKKGNLNGKINVFAYDDESKNSKKKKKEVEQIDCRQCKEELKIKIKDYRLTLECKNDRIWNNIPLENYNDFEKKNK